MRLFKLPGNDNITIDLDKIVYVKGPKQLDVHDKDKRYIIHMIGGDSFAIYDSNFWPSNYLPYEDFLKMWAGDE